ncbi:hypothetical protein [Streptomyces sp. NPDC002520]
MSTRCCSTSSARRLYRGSDGRAKGAPSVAELRRALAEANAAVDCEGPPTDAAGRGDRGRLAPVAGGLRPGGLSTP